MGENQQVDQEVNSKNKKVLYSSGYAMILVTHTCFSTFSSVWFSFFLSKLFVWFASFLLSTLLFYLLIKLPFGGMDILFSTSILFIQGA